MKIKKVSTDQFAGIRDKEISFDDGINVVFGKNESGKSTLVNLISRTLFQDAKTDRRRDKEFLSRYFPGEIKGSSAKNSYIHGKVVFESDGGEYIITKEWGDDPVCRLSSPFGITKNQADINAELKKALVYGEGVYSEMLLSSQHNTDISLRAILDSSEESGAKKEITDVITKAFSESDGISAEDMEKAINKKIEELEGKHWDTENCVPVRKSGRWASGIGEIHKAYYAFEDAKAAAEEVLELEAKVAAAETDYKTAKAKKDDAEKEFSVFSDFSTFLATRGERRKNLERFESDLEKYEAAAKKWPLTVSNLEKAKILEKEQKNRETLDKYNRAKPIFEEISSLKEQLKNLRRPTDEDISSVKNANSRIDILRNKLCGINLSAAIKMFGENSIEIKSLVSGKNLYNGEENIVIKEAVSLKIPGVMEMQLAPANVDFEKIEQEIIKNKASISKILIEYGVSDTESLEKLAKNFAKTEDEIRTKEMQINRITGFIPFSELENEAKLIDEDPRETEEIENDIRLICGCGDIHSFITESKVIADSFESEYVSPEKLAEKISDCKKAVAEYEKSEEEAENIPEKYLNISDPQEHLKKLKNAIDSANDLCIDASEAKTTALVNLANFNENHPDPKSAVEESKIKFTEQKQLLEHWHHIKEVFEKVRGNFRGNPMEKLSESFTNYLRIISSERISSEFPNQEKLDMDIYSGNSKLDYGKLSEGTKETVSLAFRLAVLDHLFPEGGGIIVFDDPFTDMDAPRTAKSCELIRECAKKHQVIFLTCNEDYKDILKGKIIDI